MKTVSFITLGCRFNQSESEAMLHALMSEGFCPEADPLMADVVVVNTCAVTTESERKSRKAVRAVLRRRSRSPQKIIVVTGCYANLAPEEVAALQPDLVLGNAEKMHLAKWIHRAQSETTKPVVSVTPVRDQPTLSGLAAHAPQMRTRAFFRIQDGCQRWCSYCIIPLFRGKERSLHLPDILRTLKELDDQGVREVVLTGIHLASWGRDQKPPGTIKDLVLAIADLPLRLRVRWSSLEPEETTPDFLRSVLTNRHRFCPHFHLALQSGSNRILKKMKRGYTTERYRRLIEQARAIDPRATFTTDVIVGFPGETDQDFEDTLMFVEECRFLKVHAFSYTPRPGTPAARMEPLPPRLIHRRMTRLLMRAEAIRREILFSYLGTTQTLLIEQHDPQDATAFYGYSEYYIPVMVQGENLATGTFVRGVATGVCGDRLVIDTRIGNHFPLETTLARVRR